MNLIALALLPPTVLQAPEQDTPGPPPPLEVLVRSTETGAPIEGARVLAGYERLHPTWGEAWWRAEKVTDAQGAAELPRSVEGAAYDRVVAVAPGFGTLMVHTSARTDSPLEMTLPPEVPLELELVFEDGKPASLVHVGAAFGCGHTPDVFSAVSDYRGRVTLRGLAPLEDHWDFELYPVGEGVYFDSLEFQEPWEAGVRQRVVVQRGRKVKGQVIGIDGRPAAGIFVGQPQRHRGPWARTDEEGRFTLWGIAPDSSYLEMRDADDQWLGAREAAGRGLDVLIRLIDERNGGEPPATYPAVVDLSGSMDLAGVENVDIEFWSPYTGLRTMTSPEASGVCEAALEQGWYFVEVGSPGGAVEQVHAGAVWVGPEDPVSPPRNRVKLGVHPITNRRIEILSPARLQVWRLETIHGKSRYRHFDDWEVDPKPADDDRMHISRIDERWLPECKWTLSVKRMEENEDGTPSPWLPTEVVSDDGRTLTLRLQ